MNGTKTQKYRVVATTTTGFVDPKIHISYPWIGTDTDELSRMFPPSDIMFADPLFQKEIEDGFIITRFTFERRVLGGKDILDETGNLVGVTADRWEVIDDPRRRLTPITPYERAIDEENRRLFPGDYISECDDCGYDPCRCDPYDDQYRVDCKSCDDYGCAKCDPKWCANCDNQGCATCDPQGVCKDCSRYMADVETLDENGRCSDCVYYASLCTQCQYYGPDGEDHLCGNCRSDNESEAAIKCDNCDNVVVLNKGDNCPSCQAYLDSLCVACQYDDVTGDDKLCGDCREYYSDQEKYYVWWRRALRACKFWRS